MLISVPHTLAVRFHNYILFLLLFTPQCSDFFWPFWGFICFDYVRMHRPAHVAILSKWRCKQRWGAPELVCFTLLSFHFYAFSMLTFSSIYFYCLCFVCDLFKTFSDLLRLINVAGCPSLRAERVDGWCALSARKSWSVYCVSSSRWASSAASWALWVRWVPSALWASKCSWLCARR